MEPYYAGWLSILPPVIAITLALITKDVISSLLIGIFTGTTIYAFNAATGFAPMVIVEAGIKVIVDKFDLNIVMFCSLLGALVYVISMSGGARAYGAWATKRISSRRASLLSTSGLGAFIFIDDYFNCLTVGTVMTPITDQYKVSRAKLAYIIDSTAAPVCIIAPISSWAASVGSNLKATGAFTSDFAAFVSTIPYNLYALLSLAMVLIISWTGLDFGPMRKAELRAAKGELGVAYGNAQQMGIITAKGTILDMLVPMGALILFAVLGLLYNGGYWGTNPAYHSVSAALGNCTAAPALVWASFGALLVALVIVVPRGLLTFKEFMDGVMEGIKLMVPANLILALAWGISGVCRDLLQMPQFVQHAVQGGGFPAALLPAVIFVIAGFLSFSTGTAWGTFGILIPIVVLVAQALDPNILMVSLAATLAGSVFGDHCSPISDTTILSSAGAGCQHVEHVSTQLGYALTVAGCSLLGYLVAGFTGGTSPWPGLLSSLAALCLVLVVIKVRQKPAESVL